jgi:hypothetical protein
MERGLNVLGGLIDNQKYLLGDTQELAPLVPDHVKKPQKSFGELLPVPQDLMSEWKDLNATEMPPAPSLPDMSRQNDDMIFDDTNPEQESTDLDLQPQENIQEVLRFILGELIGEVYDFTSELPETMPQAELEMRNSTTTLDDQRPDLSVPIQEEVIRLLEQAQQDLQEQMQEQMEQRTGMQMRQGQTDPLGRPQGEEEYIGPREDSDVEVPDQFDRRRIDEILEYLRKHAGDPERSRIEREYFKRLLRAF